ncbi:GH3 auxin-responsive promoter family protein [Lyngbya confervoides]|uniref:Uncharacterized protein n=1 Tax=Lyngbya confervoides BDU141951 TaxID=1574623 RepID=A0ABD4T3B8_9CYAN|nr:GH3 auxin-responsive promoter family protein [Lyngbya confervoides]MCM1982933.1 hypothetical protein [Lyngbya confervoides BDU141951]
MLGLVPKAVTAFATYEKSNFIRRSQTVEGSQQRFLDSLLTFHRNTEMGRRFHLGEIRTHSSQAGKAVRFGPALMTDSVCLQGKTSAPTPYGPVMVRSLRNHPVWNRLRQRWVNRGMSDSQLKIPHLSEDRDSLAEFSVLEEVSFPAAVPQG